jgi:hypothetical protein
MRIQMRFSFVPAVATLLCVGLSIPTGAFAAGDPAKPAASPKPDSQKKVWTNDDVERLNPAFVENRAPQTSTPSAATLTIVTVPPLAPAPHRVVARAPLAPEQDPRWYAQQVTALEAELSAIASHEDELRQFRATSAGLPTGLVLNAPVEGITTDNLIAQLEARRQEIAQQIDGLGDLARQNDLPPGILVEGRGLAEIADQSPPEEQRAAAENLVRDASDQLAEVQGIVAGMHDQVSSQGITLLQPTPGEGGNMTTDLLERLDSRANDLQGVISSAQDAALGMGVQPGDLR